MSRRKRVSEFQLADALVAMLRDQLGRRFGALTREQQREINEDCLALARKVVGFEVPK